MKPKRPLPFRQNGSENTVPRPRRRSRPENRSSSIGPPLSFRTDAAGKLNRAPDNFGGCNRGNGWRVGYKSQARDCAREEMAFQKKERVGARCRLSILKTLASPRSTGIAPQRIERSQKPAIRVR